MIQDEHTDEPSVNFRFVPAGLAGLGAFVVLGVVTAVLPSPFFKRMIPVYFWDYLFLGTTSLLAAYYFGQSDDCRTRGDEGFAAAGGMMGFFAFACPVCNALLVSLFSAATIMTYLDPLRPYLGLASTAILVFFLYRDSTCAVNPEASVDR